MIWKDKLLDWVLGRRKVVCVIKYIKQKSFQQILANVEGTGSSGDEKARMHGPSKKSYSNGMNSRCSAGKWFRKNWTRHFSLEMLWFLPFWKWKNIVWHHNDKRYFPCILSDNITNIEAQKSINAMSRTSIYWGPAFC